MKEQLKTLIDKYENKAIDAREVLKNDSELTLHDEGYFDGKATYCRSIARDLQELYDSMPDDVVEDKALLKGKFCRLSGIVPFVAGSEDVYTVNAQKSSNTTHLKEDASVTYYMEDGLAVIVA